jgi:hypothetical protein
MLRAEQLIRKIIEADEGTDTRPTPADVLYVEPNPDGTRKACGNCWKFVRTGACLEVLGPISPTQNCGYYVFGVSQDAELSVQVFKCSPELAGLIQAPPGGTCCGNCKAYQPGDYGSPTPTDKKLAEGRCSMVQDGEGNDAVVRELGCCSRWTDIASGGGSSPRPPSKSPAGERPSPEG